MRFDEHQDGSEDLFPGLCAVLLLPVLWLWEGYAFSVLWKWFAVVHFGLKPISVGLAMGLMVLGWGAIGFPTFGRNLGDEMRKKRSGKAQLGDVGLMFLLPATGLLIGYIAKELA